LVTFLTVFAVPDVLVVFAGLSLSGEADRVGLAFRFVDAVIVVGSSIGAKLKASATLGSFVEVDSLLSLLLVLSLLSLLPVLSLLSLLLVLSLLAFLVVVLFVVAVLEEADLSGSFVFLAGDVDLARAFASDGFVVVGGSKLGGAFVAAFVVVEAVVILQKALAPRNAVSTLVRLPANPETCTGPLRACSV